VLPQQVVKVFGSLAQLVEQRTFNPLVAGSNPARPTKYVREANRSRLAFFVFRTGYSSPSPYLPGVTPITRLNMAMKALTLS
jgi:hypothetical protein